MPRAPLVASTNAAVAATPKKAKAAPPPPPPPPPPSSLRAQPGSQVPKAAPAAQVSAGAPPGVPTVRDLAGGLAALRKVQLAQLQQSSPVAPPAPPAQPAVPAKAAAALVVHPDQLARARAALRKTGTAAPASPKAAASPAGCTPKAKKQAAASPKAGPASRNATPSRAVRAIASPQAGVPAAAAAAEEPSAGGAPDFTFARSPAVLPAPASPARLTLGGSARKAPVVGWMPFAGQPLVESPAAGGEVCMTERLVVEEEPEAVPVPDATEMLVDFADTAGAPAAAPATKRRSSVAFAPLPAVSPRAGPSAGVPRRRSTPFRARPAEGPASADAEPMDASPDRMQPTAAAASPTMLGLAPWMVEAGAPQEQAAPVAAPTVTPLRARRQSMRATDEAEVAAMPVAAAVEPDAMVATMAAELLAVRAELLRAKKALRVSKRQVLALRRALRDATPSEAPGGIIADSQVPVVVVLRPCAEAVDAAARPQGAVRAGDVVVVYAEHAPAAAAAPVTEVAVMAEPVAMAVDDAVVAAVEPTAEAPPPAPSSMFQSPKKQAPQEASAAAVGNDPTTFLPGWLFAGDTALNVTPRSGTRHKSMAARAVGAPAVQPEDGESSMPPLVLSFDVDVEAVPMDPGEELPAPADAAPAPAHEDSAAAGDAVVDAGEVPAEALPPMPSPVPAPAPVAEAVMPEAAVAAAVEAPARLEAASGAALVGSRVVVWWPLDKAWYPGVVSAYAARGKKHTVVYDDGQKEAVSLAAVFVRDAALHAAAMAAGLRESPEEEEQPVEEVPVAPSAKKAAKGAASKRARPVEAVAAALDPEPAAKRVTRSRRA